MLFEQILNGIVLGSMYALIAQGYTLVFGVLDKLNFAHGEIFMLGGFVLLASVALGAPLALAVLITVIVAGLLGLVVEFVGFRKFRSRDAHITAALSSFAIGLVMIGPVWRVARSISWARKSSSLGWPSCSFRSCSFFTL